MNENIITSIRARGISAKAATSTQIGVTENGTQRFYPLFVTFHQATASALTIPMTASVGSNASSYNNILPATLQTNLLAQYGQNPNFPPLGSSNSIAPNTAIYVNVTIAATGVSGTFDVEVVGYYS